MTQEPPKPKRREFEITRKLLEKHGYHSNCSSCDAVLNRTSQRPHSAACRNRLEEEMEADFEDVQRLIDRDVRLRRDTSEDKIHEAQHPDAEVEAVSPTKDAVAESVERPSGTTETRSAAAKRPAEHPAEQHPPDALPVEMRTHDDLVQSSRNVLYGEADGDVDAALGSGTSLTPQQHDETGVSESLYFLGKRRRLDIIADSARRLLGKFGLGKSAGAKQHLERMMSGLLGEKNQSSSIRSSDVSKIMQILEKMESPHEDEQWRELYDNVEFTDDVNGGNALDKDKVIAARRFEMQFFKKMGVFEKVDRKEVRSSGGKIITTKWVDTDKGHGGYRSRLVGRELKRDKRLDLYAPTPPLETLKLLVAYCAKSQGTPKPKRIGIFDVSRAYFYAPCQRPIFIEIPDEDWEVCDKHRLGV